MSTLPLSSAFPGSVRQAGGHRAPLGCALASPGALCGRPSVSQNYSSDLLCYTGDTETNRLKASQGLTSRRALPSKPPQMPPHSCCFFTTLSEPLRRIVGGLRVGHVSAAEREKCPIWGFCG